VPEISSQRLCNEICLISALADVFPAEGNDVMPMYSALCILSDSPAFRGTPFNFGIRGL
jgi:hypothetical protein